MQNPTVKHISRYAPSPTGPLHLGNLRTALLAWLQARLSHAEFILRMEDLDTPRVKTGSAQQILDDLLTLGLSWDKGPQGQVLNEYYQSQRQTHYQQAFIELYKKNLIYPCFCSRRDIREAASAPHGNLGIYPGTCRNNYPHITPDNEVIKNNRLPAWRFKTQKSTLSFEDKIKGTIKIDIQETGGDFVIRRSDGLFAYQLAVVVDDIDMQITDVLRGEDLLESTAKQLLLYQAFNKPQPSYWHVPLYLTSQGKRMAKRDHSLSLKNELDNGKTINQVIGELAASCGLVDTGTAISTTKLLASLTLKQFIDSVKE